MFTARAMVSPITSAHFKVSSATEGSMSADGPEFNPAMQADEALTPFDVSRSSEKAGLLKLVIGLCLLTALIYIAIKIYQPGVRDRGDPPLITADNTPFKIVPEDPGGIETPDQDKDNR